MEILVKNKQKEHPIIIMIVATTIKTPKLDISSYTKALFFRKLSGVNNRPSFDHDREGGFSLRAC